MEETTDTRTRDSKREPVPLARYLRGIALSSADTQLVYRLTAIARHFEERAVRADATARS